MGKFTSRTLTEKIQGLKHKKVDTLVRSRYTSDIQRRYKMGCQITSTEKKSAGWVVVKGTADTYSGAEAACQNKTSMIYREENSGQFHFTYCYRENSQE
jgi:hypothetical protein